LERAKTAAEAVEVMTDLITRYGQGKFSNDQNVRTYDNGYIIADPNEAYILETAGHEWAVKRVDSAVGISNVYSIETDWDTLSPNAIEWAKSQGWWDDASDRFNFAAAFSRDADRSVGSGAMRRRRSCAVLSNRTRGLNDEVCGRCGGQIGAEAKPAQDLRGRIGRERTLFHLAVQVPGDRLAGLGQRRLVHVDQRDLVAVLREDVGDAVAQGA
jgi:hypothetical protein